ncbi:hypothetical protein [Methylomicrobium lacus]|uniref:hypothetical protein n=1 Tax=Methylomicrobium lacus TaxID=136992 RepID=UPI0035A86A3E
MNETEYLLAENNAERLRESIEQLKAGKTERRELIRHLLPQPMPRFLDIEASSLSMDSYPIEVGWSDPEGNIESHLINPYAIEAWTDWDYNAQQVHGLSREQCRQEGIHPEWLCQRMSESVPAGEILYADGGGFDESWIDVLFSVSSAFDHPPFRVVHTDAVMLPLLMKVEPDEKKRWQLYENLILQARATVGGRHRAGIDVRYLIELWRLCLNQSQA